MKAELKKWIDANVWDGEDRSGCHGDFVSHSPDDLQDLIDDLYDYEIKPKYEAVVSELECAKNDIELLNKEIAAFRDKQLKMTDEYNELIKVRIFLQSEIYDLKIENKKQALEYITLAGQLQEHLKSLTKVKADAVRDAADKCFAHRMDVDELELWKVVRNLGWYANELERGES